MDVGRGIVKDQMGVENVAVGRVKVGMRTGVDVWSRRFPSASAPSQKRGRRSLINHGLRKKEVEMLTLNVLD